MGIKGLAHVLQPYATRSDFPERHEAFDETPSASPRQREGQQPQVHAGDDNLVHASAVTEIAVVDGPALAYHAYYRALRMRSSSGSALEALPAYREVNQIAEKCLDTLQRHGIRVRAVFFDGGLPDAKRPVRLERLTATLRQLANYRTDHWAAPVSGQREGRPTLGSPSTLFSAVQLPAKLMALPALPFLVPSVIEALRHGPFGAVTTLVPGEADTHCAAYAKKHGGMVITSDSDLLVFDLGSTSSVLLLRDIEQIESSSSSVLRLTRYWPPSIAKRFALPSLQPFAYAVAQDPHASINSNIRHAQELQVSPSNEYKDFLKQYGLPSDEIILEHSSLSGLDPRLSEWMYETMSTKRCIHEKSIHSTDINMYLPVLLEDTTRASAWNVGESVRAISYSTLLPPVPGRFGYKTAEIARRGTRIDSKMIEHVDLGTTASYLSGLIVKLAAADDAVPPRMKWPFLGVHDMCEYLLSEGKALPDRTTLKALLRNQTPPRSWEHVHLSAQMQAVVYSYRMLGQCLFIKRSEIHVDDESIDDTDATYKHFEHMPSIPVLFDHVIDAEEQEVDTTIDAMYKMLGIEESASQGETSNTKRKRKKKSQAEARGQKVSKTTLGSSNMYDILLAEE